MKYIGDLITEARNASKNGDYDYDSATGTVTRGIGQDQILRYVNDAQDRLQSKISQAKPQSRPFTKEQNISIVGNQQGYSVTDRVFFGQELELVEFSYSGNNSDFTPLRKISNFNNNTNQADYPIGYYRQESKIYLVPLPSLSQGVLRVKYQRSLDDLDIRRGKVTARTLSSTQLTALTLDAGTDDGAAIQNKTDKYFCVNDADGNVKMYNIPYTSYDTATGVVTLPAFTFASGESVAVGDYVTLGKYTTTHSKLVDEAEGFLVEYMVAKLNAQDSSNDIVESNDFLKEGMKIIVAQYKSQSAEIQLIPEFNSLDWY